MAAVEAPVVVAVPQIDAAPAQSDAIELAAPEEDELLSALGGAEESEEE